MSGSGGQSNVEIDPQQVSNATAQMDATASKLQSSWSDAISAIEGLNNAGTWGTDGPGEEFQRAYTESGGTEVGAKGQAAVTDVGEFGPDVRTAVQNSLASDEVQAGQVDVDVRGL